jgi:hypothetical protein
LRSVVDRVPLVWEAPQSRSERLRSRAHLRVSGQGFEAGLEPIARPRSLGLPSAMRVEEVEDSSDHLRMRAIARI